MACTMERRQKGIRGWREALQPEPTPSKHSTPLAFGILPNSTLLTNDVRYLGQRTYFLLGVEGTHCYYVKDTVLLTRYKGLKDDASYPLRQEQCFILHSYSTQKKRSQTDL